MVKEPAAVAMAYLLPRQARLRRWLEAWKGYRLPRSSYQQRVNVPDVGSILRQVSELSLLPGGPRLRDPIQGRCEGLVVHLVEELPPL